MIEESNEVGNSMSQVARKYGLSPSQICLWKKFMIQGANSAVEAEEEVVAISEVRQLQAKIRELERILGRKSMENEILKEAVAIAKKKKLISHVPLLPPEDFL
jgi:transposase